MNRISRLLRSVAPPRRLASRRGVALILALWVLVIMSVLGVELSVFTRGDTGATRYLKESVQTRYIARGGLERGLGLIADYYRRYPASALAAKALGRDLRAVKEERPPLLAYLAARGIQRVPLGEGEFTLRFEDLSGRVNVNRVDPALLANLAQMTGLSRTEAEEAADGILDWVDADSLHRAHGAEAEYYARRGLPSPRNAPLLQLEELLLVKGVTPRAFYGEGPRGRVKGLARFLTTEGSGKINVNTAPAEVLLAIPGMDRGTVSRILSTRPVRQLRSIQEVLGSDPEGQLGANPLLGVLSFETTEMRVEAAGQLAGSETRSRVRATIGIMPAGVIVRNWQDDFPTGLALAPAPLLGGPGAP